LPELAGPLYDAGLRRINIHLDTLDPSKFKQIVRRDGFERVLDGVFACKRLGYDPVKLNAVAIRGLTEDDLVPLAQFGREHGIEVRFIEFMPLDADGKWQRDKVLFAAASWTSYRSRSRRCQYRTRTHGPGQRVHVQRRRGADRSSPRSVSRFMSCNRIRLTSDGKRNCLFALDSWT
jgi:cyclic pyranopterin phosphate synthase